VITTVDFETGGIQKRPLYPPPPVGVSIKLAGGDARYYAWGHPTGNNCTLQQAREALSKVWGGELIFHNGKFDLDVANVHLDLPIPSWTKVHDTMFLIFLNDPHQDSLGLKPSAELLLGMLPEERDEVGAWLVAKQPVPGVKVSLSPSSKSYYGKYIYLAPGALVGKYANGDTERTWRLYVKLIKEITESCMLSAYNRERKLMINLIDIERRGVQIDRDRLSGDVSMYGEYKDKLESWLHKRLGNINLDSGAQLVRALASREIVDVLSLPRTPTGKASTSHAALTAAIRDPQLAAALSYRAHLGTCLSTFMAPWLDTAWDSGRIYTNWNQVRQYGSEGDAVGARTGRLSSSPNFQNIPSAFEALFSSDAVSKPPPPIHGLPRLPEVRSYVTPFPGEVIIGSDYSQQELRILSHFDGGRLMEKYQQNPWIDFHDSARDELDAMGLHYERKPVKLTNFGLIYGMGTAKLADSMGTSLDEAKTLKNAILNLYPGIKELYNEMRRRAQLNEPIRTWGGRLYYCEKPRVVEGKLRTYDYKMVNKLIQGSAADCTKEAINRFYDRKDASWRLILNVHDELVVSAPHASWLDALYVLRESMEGVDFDVPMLTESKYSCTNWAEMIAYDKKGKEVSHV